MKLSRPDPPSYSAAEDAGDQRGGLEDFFGICAPVAIVSLKGLCDIGLRIRWDSIELVDKVDRVKYGLVGTLSAKRQMLVASITHQDRALMEPRREVFVL